MRRWWVILLCVLLGAVVHLRAANIGMPPVSSFRFSQRTITGSGPWPLNSLPEGFPPQADSVSVHQRVGLRYVLWSGGERGFRYRVERIEWGWPLTSLSRTEQAVDDTWNADSSWRTGVTRVRWIGAVLNTAVYSSIVWGVLWAAVMLHRLQHRPPRPGRCARCKYDLTGLAAGAACPECGEAARAAEVPA